MKQNKSIKRSVWCKKHPSSFWGKRIDGTYFSKCSEGFNKNEDCKMVVAKKTILTPTSEYMKTNYLNK